MPLMKRDATIGESQPIRRSVELVEKAEWVKNRAAMLSNLNRTTLVEKIKRDRISPPCMAAEA